MGTRGAFGFRLNGADKVTYNYWDSYPSALGANVLAFIAQTRLGYLAGLGRDVDKLRVVTDDDKPREDDIDALKAYTDTEVGSKSTDDWYCLTRKCQGDIGMVLESGYLLEGASFLHDSLFCEWAYIINLDDLTFECYKGFNKNPAADGRYASLQRPKGGEYFGVRLVKSWPLTSLPSPSEFESTMEPPPDEDDD